MMVNYRHILRRIICNISLSILTIYSHQKFNWLFTTSMSNILNRNF